MRPETLPKITVNPGPYALLTSLIRMISSSDDEYPVHRIHQHCCIFDRY